MDKNQAYKQIKLVGLLTFIPITLAAGPLTGYFAADFLIKKFNFKPYSVYIFIATGFLASIIEVIKIIKIAYKAMKS